MSSQHNGWLRVIGLGPGPAQWLTPEALDVLHEATDIVGYIPYVESVPESVKAIRHATDNRVEIDRAKHALEMASAGARVAVVSGGDAGVFGMATAIYEAMEAGMAAWRDLDITVVPGMTALLAASARVGAPLGHDFCVMSLSDYLKPWDVIEKRLIAASEGDFVLALYNPASKTRREQIVSALDCLRKHRGNETIVIVAASVGREQERITLTTLGKIDPAIIDMRTLLIIGSSRTRRIERAGKDDVVFTPRFYKEVP